MSSTSESIPKIIDLLESMTLQDRKKVMNSIRGYFDESILDVTSASGLGGSVADVLNSVEGVKVVPQAAIWLKKHELQREQLDNLFYFAEEKFDLLAEVPGKSKKEKTYNVYLLGGVAGLLTSGVPHVSDEIARSFCEKQACYDQANHANYMKEIGGIVSGDKKNGWTLTSPGLSRAGALVKELLGTFK
jgi:hypothetical protein